MKTSNKLLLGLVAFLLTIFTAMAVYAKLHFQPNGLVGEGNETEMERPTLAFTKLTIEGPLDVYLTEGTPNIRLKGYENLLQAIETQTVEGELQIGIKKKIGMDERIEVHLTMQDLQQLNLSGGTRIQTDSPLKGKSLKIKGQGGIQGNFELFYDELTCESIAGSQIELRGAVPKAAFVFSSGSQLDANSLRVESCLAKGSSGATAEVNVSEDLSADLESAASLEYSGSPVLKDIKTKSAGRVNKK